MSEGQSSQVPSKTPALIVIAGPTASGKTNAAVGLCKCIAHLPAQSPCGQDMPRRNLEKLFKRMQ